MDKLLAKPVNLHSGQLGRIHVPKASDLLASRIQEQILTGALPEGRPLPTERELVIETGLGRSTIREALRILENRGFVAIRTGRNGGSVVSRPGRASLESSIGTFIRGQNLRMEALVEARVAFEPAAARFAAIHRNEEDLAELDEIQARLGRAVESRDLPTYLLANVEWHLGVVRASHNELLIAFMTAIAQAVHAATEVDDFNSHDVRTATLQAHQRIQDAIFKQDPAAAERRMRRHVEAYVELFGSSSRRTPRRSTRKAQAK